MSDVVVMLRSLADSALEGPYEQTCKLQMRKAADEIERLRADFKAREAGWNETVRLYNQAKAELQAFREAVATIPPVPSTEGKQP